MASVLDWSCGKYKYYKYKDYKAYFKEKPMKMFICHC